MRVISNTAVSLDGKISLTKGELFKLGTGEDHRRMSLIRAQADAVLVGGYSFRTWPKPALPRLEDQKRDYQAKPLLNVIVSRSGELNFTPEYLSELKIHSLLLTSSKARFPVETIYFDEVITPVTILEVLQKRGVKTLLIEGGGELIAQFLEAGLLNEMYITLCPLLIGGLQAPSLVQGAGFDKDHLKNLKLLECDVVGDELYLHYEVSR